MKNLPQIPNKPSNKAINDFIARTKYAIECGDISALDVLVFNKVISSLVEKIKKSEVIKSEAFSEASRYAEKEVITSSNSEITRASTARYDYSNSPIHVELAAKVKEIEAIAKATKTKGIWIDPETGEQFDVLPAIKKSTDYFKVKLPRT